MKIHIQESKKIQLEPIRFADLKDGDFFQYQKKDGLWEDGVYFMLDKSKGENGQCYRLPRNGQCYRLPRNNSDWSGPTWFVRDDAVSFRIFTEITFSGIKETK